MDPQRFVAAPFDYQFLGMTAGDKGAFIYGPSAAVSNCNFSEDVFLQLFPVSFPIGMHQ